MTLSDAHQQYHQFIESSDVINRILSAYPQIAAEQSADFYQTVQRFNYLLMFLAQFMAFEGFINACLREIPQIQAELQLRNAWMHGCGDDSLVESTQLKRCRMPQSVLDHDPVANRDWISGAAWSETASLLGQLVSCVARELEITS